MPIRNLDALFEPRSTGIMAESFAPGTHGGLALAAVASTKPKAPVVLIRPAPAGAPFCTVPSLPRLGKRRISFWSPCLLVTHRLFSQALDSAGREPRSSHNMTTTIRR